MNTKVTAIIIGILVICIALVYFIFFNNTYKVTFDTAGGSIVDTQIVEKSKTAIRPGNPVRIGYVFDDWYLDGEVFDFSTPITKSITLVAKWKKKNVEENTIKFTVSFDTDGGNEIPNEIVEKYGKVSEPDEPTKSGYDFVCWLLNGEEFDFNTKITKDIKLVAKWEKVVKSNANSNNKTNSGSNEEPIIEDKPSDEPQEIKVKSISLSKTKYKLNVGERFRLIATINPSNATNKTLKWSSSNESVATVDENGEVIAVSEGTAIITVKSGNITAICTITVTEDAAYIIEWVEIVESSVGQYTLYIKSSKGNYVAGKAKITTVAGKVEIVDIPKKGKIYIKSAIESATVESVN